MHNRPRLLGGSGRSCLVLFLLAALPHQLLAQIQSASLELFDSNNVAIGTVLDHHGPNGVVTVPLVVDGHTTLLTFTTDSVDTFGTAGGSGVFFASVDCTGQGFALNFGPEEFLEPQAVAGPNNDFYAGAPSAVVPGPFSYNSALRHGQSCSAESASLSNALPVFLVRSLTPPWQPPFRLIGVPGGRNVPAVSTVGLLTLALALGAAGMLLLRLRSDA